MTTMWDEVSPPSLLDVRDEPLGDGRWLGNEFWLVLERRTASGDLELALQTDPWPEVARSRPEAQLGAVTLGTLTLPGPVRTTMYTEDSCSYELPQGRLTVFVPLQHEAVVLFLGADARSRLVVPLRQPTDAETAWPVRVDGGSGCRVGSRAEGQRELVIAPGSWMTVSLCGGREEERGMPGPIAMIQASRHAWAEYLDSCPLVDLHEMLTQTDATADCGARLWTGADAGSRFRDAQRWTWRAVRANLARSRCTGELYLAPDRPHWEGTWSNDTPEALAGLSCTGARALAREAIVSYVRTNFTDDGDLSWYASGSGMPCLGAPGNSGRLSHGLPLIANTVRVYVEETGDDSILDAPVRRDVNLWQMLRRWFDRVLEERDRDGDGLVEWRNLWETGWDNKAGPFFSRFEESADHSVGDWHDWFVGSGVESWRATMVEGSDEEVARLYRERSAPVVALAEQVHFLTALLSIQQLARRAADAELEGIAARRCRRIVNVLETRHWDEVAGFYFDWDVLRGQLAAAPCLDGVYVLAYCHATPDRVARVLDTFLDARHFGLAHPPTLSASHPLFDPLGYWRGSSWPRETGYVSAALRAAGRPDLAADQLLRAIACIEGCVVPETVDPRSGRCTSQSTVHAYDVTLLLSMLQQLGRGRWSPSPSLLKPDRN